MATEDYHENGGRGRQEGEIQTFTYLLQQSQQPE